MSLKFFFAAFCLMSVVWGVYARLSGNGWDAYYLLHPDEMFLVMVASNLAIPDSLFNYLNSQISSFNPHNRGYDFFVYGTLPLLLLKLVSGSVQLAALVSAGRYLSALFDIGTLVLLFFLGRKLGSPLLGLVSSAVYALSALPLQLSHFFAVDPPMVFFSTLAFLLSLSTSASLSAAAGSGIAFGLALSCKISAVLFLPALLLNLAPAPFWRRPRQVLSNLLLFSLAAFVSLRLAYPSLFSSPISLSLNPQVLADWSELKSLSTPTAWFPPAFQWVPIVKGLHPLLQTTLVGLGLPLAALSAAGLLLVARRFKSPGHPSLIIAIFGVWVYQSLQFAQPLRYFYPVYPLLAVCAAFALLRLFQFSRLLTLAFLPLLLLWPLSVHAIFVSPHPRVLATDWVKTHLPSGSVLSCDHWDDCLPLDHSYGFVHVELPMFVPDDPAKWADLRRRLASLDYLIVSSNRVYASIQSDPRFPQTRQFYSDLFSGRSEFRLVAQFASRPRLPLSFVSLCVPLPLLNYGSIASPATRCSGQGIEFIDDYAEEPWTVYDHPKVFVFQNVAKLRKTPNP